MKTQFTCVALIMFCISLLKLNSITAQTISYNNIRQSGGNGNVTPLGSTADKNGNLYICGVNNGDSVTFGTIKLYKKMLNNYFLVKYNPSGNVVWAKTAQPNYSQSVGIGASTVITDTENNVYMSGSFNGNLIIDGDTVSAANAFYLVKFDSMGNKLWLRYSIPYGNIAAAAPNQMVVDNSSNVYICGKIQGDSINFGNNQYIAPRAVYNVNYFFVKYDKNGICQWAKTGKGGSKLYAKAQSVATDDNNNVYLAGNFGYDSMTLDNVNYLQGDTARLPMFIAKYNGAGQCEWVRHSGNDESYIADIAIHHDKIYVVGNFYSDSMAYEATTLYNATSGQTNLYSNFFYLKLDTNGNTNWLKRGYGKNHLNAVYVTTDNDGKVYASGYVSYVDTCYFDSSSLPLVTRNNTQFILQYNENGDIECMGVNPLMYTNHSHHCLVNNNGTIVLASSYSSALSPFTLGTHVFPPTGYNVSNSLLADIGCETSTGLAALHYNAANIEIYPNPANAFIYVTYNTDLNYQNYSISISDYTGKTLQYHRLLNNSGQININTLELQSGLYFCTLIVDGKNTATKKLIIAH